MLRTLVATLLIALAAPAAATASHDATVLAISPAGNALDVAVAIPKGIDNAARNGHADFALRVTVTYVSNTGTVETVDSGRVSIGAGTTFLADLDSNTVSVLLVIPLGGRPAPGNNPSFDATAELLHPGSG